MQVHNFEIYTKHPQTFETGWDIVQPSIFAKTKHDAVNYLKTKYPLFDCIILHNYSTDIKDGSKDAEMYATGVDYYLPTYKEQYN